MRQRKVPGKDDRTLQQLPENSKGSMLMRHPSPSFTEDQSGEVLIKRVKFQEF